MDRRNLLQRFEEQLEKVLEKPFTGEPPLDVEQLKARLLAAIQETGTPYVPDRWYVRLPEGLRVRDEEVRALVDAVWRSLVASVEPQEWAEGATPQIDVAYDPTLTGNQMMVGYEFTVSSGPLYSAPPRSRAERARDLWDTQVRSRLVSPREPAPARRASALGSLLKLVAVVALVLGIGLAIAVVVVDLGRAELRRLAPEGASLPALEVQLPPVEWPRLEWPNFDWRSFDLPSLFASSAKEYRARNDLHVRREPSSRAEMVGMLPKDERVRVIPQQIVQGEPVQGEARWVDLTPPAERLTGARRYVWFGGLEPLP